MKSSYKYSSPLLTIVTELYVFVRQALSHIHVQLGQTEKALEYLKKAAKFDPRDPEV